MSILHAPLCVSHNGADGKGFSVAESWISDTVRENALWSQKISEMWGDPPAQQQGSGFLDVRFLLGELSAPVTLYSQPSS